MGDIIKGAVNIKGIVSHFLILNKYNGLVDADGECGCSLGEDFMVCDEPKTDCVAGYLIPCNCVDAHCEYHIVATKPESLEEVER